MRSGASRLTQLTVIGLALLLLPTSAWPFGFSVEPARATVSVPPGKRRGKTLTVRNARTDAPIHLTVYIRDVINLPDGTLDFPPVGSTAWSCGSWVTVVPVELDIPPDSTEEIRVSVTAPPDAEGGQYAMLFFETGPTYTEEAIGVNFRVGALVEAVIPGTERFDAVLREVEIVSDSEIRTELFNLGNLLIRPKGVVKVFDNLEKKVLETPLNPNQLGVLPQTLRAISTTWSDPLGPGSYRVKVEVDYGAQTLIVGERAFEIP